ncbi:hypothetical protein GIS00_13630 [Nakamurella sp. YIM 132087]|uniref:Molecular chaperone DnaJ n=1 Tax=Nakamurella alba TaxID=2665158 RepID=A0A7K1FLP1_9ACTN|nr:hypothetical protein [Nakamurella alba]MTD14980.1 hypothetical protein [Nakamurella alba]
MSTSWSGRTSRRPQEAAAQAALDGAVAAFLDLDNRQSYVADAIAAVNELAGPDTAAGTSALQRSWAKIADDCLQASGRYLDVSNRFRLTDELDRPTNVDAGAAQRAFLQVHHELADAANAVDAFYRKHSAELESARAQRSATPQLAAEAKQAALAAERELTRAEEEGVAYPSVQDAAGELISALGSLSAAEGSGRPGMLRQAAAAVRSAASQVTDRVTRARTLAPAVKSSMASVRTRIEAVTTRLDNLGTTRSALLREFSAASTRDLAGTDERARKALEQARGEFADAGRLLDAGEVEKAGDALKDVRRHLSEAEDGHKALTERLRVLRETRDDPQKAAKAARFRLRDAQLLVVDRGKVPEWGSVLDAQVDRIDRAVDGLTGAHPDYWGYLQALAGVESFVRGVVDKVRAEIR